MALAFAANASLSTVNVYDPTGDSNDVDRDYVTDILGSTDSNLISLGDFRTAISSAYAAGTGGVANFDGASDAADVVDGDAQTFNILFGASGTNSATLDIVNGGIASKDDRHAISGSDGLSVGNAYDVLTFKSADQITMLGVTILERDDKPSGDYSVTPVVTLNDGDTISLNLFNYTNEDKVPDLDTFMGFQLTADQIANDNYIVSLDLGMSNSSYSLIDDLGIVTAQSAAVPEPASFMLVLSAGLLTVFRRRR